MHEACTPNTSNCWESTKFSECIWECNKFLHVALLTHVALGRLQFVDLEVQLADKESELEAVTAESAAVAAQNKASLEKLVNELQVLRSNSKEVWPFSTFFHSSTWI